MVFRRVTILGTGLIGASLGKALRARELCIEVIGWDRSAVELATALGAGAITRAAGTSEEAIAAAQMSDVVVLALPVLAILDWMERLSPLLGAHQLATDVGSTKLEIVAHADRLFSGGKQALFLPGHPMAGKESSGAAVADADLFRDAAWLFTPFVRIEPAGEAAAARAEAWRACVAAMGARVIDLDPSRHDVVCAWVSHLPQMLATALAALLEDEFGEAAELRSIGGRALREMTRLGASPFSMWRDIALTNTEPLGHTLLALEQRLAHLRENLRTPELREQFETANRFRAGRYGDPAAESETPC